MARALIKHWSALSYDGDWQTRFEAHIADGGSKWLADIGVTLDDTDTQSQIKTKMAQAVRDFATAELGVTVEESQIIFPDGGRG
jgi:hypothetical protein